MRENPEIMWASSATIRYCRECDMEVIQREAIIETATGERCVPLSLSSECDCGRSYIRGDDERAAEWYCEECGTANLTTLMAPLLPKLAVCTHCGARVLVLIDVAAMREWLDRVGDGEDPARCWADLMAAHSR